MLPPFFYFNLSSPSGIATCMQFWDSAGNIASHSLIQIKKTLLLYFLNFSSVFTDILWGRGLFHVKGPCKHLSYVIWKGYLAPFVPAPKGINPFCSLQKGIRYGMQTPKNSRKSKSIACSSRIPSCSLQKGRCSLLELLQKVIKYCTL